MEVDAVFAFNDLLAFGALHTFASHGVRVPDDVAVIGFDDTEEARYSAPPLSSVSPDTEAIAATALDLLLQDDPPTPPETEMTIPFDIVKRAST